MDPAAFLAAIDAHRARLDAENAAREQAEFAAFAARTATKHPDPSIPRPIPRYLLGPDGSRLNSVMEWNDEDEGKYNATNLSIPEKYLHDEASQGHGSSPHLYKRLPWDKPFLDPVDIPSLIPTTPVPGDPMNHHDDDDQPMRLQPAADTSHPMFGLADLFPIST